VVFIIALVKGKRWALPVGVFAAAMSMFGGFPVGITDVIIQGRFSMFLVAPLISTGLLIYMLLPKTKMMVEEWQNKQIG
jgi:antibiotic biosynthesis monooxygenase (ABM) superfamily enzyme